EAVGRIERAASWAAPSDSDAVSDIGLVAARRAVSVAGADGAVTLSGPAVVVEIRPVANIAVGTVPWGMADALSTRDPATSVVGLSEHDVDVSAILASADGRPIVLVFRDLARYPWALALADAIVLARPDTISVDMGWPGQLPNGAQVVISAHGGGRVNAIAVAELLHPQLVTS
ncbi:MAG: beta-N-acetylhexosaminidase, partial [Frankiaceae bacterium]|nr:beta-N-acetylhexosaminidase [Frankiaceae bacterium]